MTIDAASKILAIIPVGLHPSSPGCAMAQAMTTMVQQKIILKDGWSMHKHSNKKQTPVEPQKNSNIFTTENSIHGHIMNDESISTDENELH